MLATCTMWRLTMCLYICNCGYFSSHTDTTIKYTCTRHWEDSASVVQTGQANWISVRANIHGFPPRMTDLPVKAIKQKGIAPWQRQQCGLAIIYGEHALCYPCSESGGRYTVTFRHSPEIGSVEGPRIPKVKYNLVTHIQAKIQRTKVELRVEETRGHIDHLTTILRGTRDSLAMD